MAIAPNSSRHRWASVLAALLLSSCSVIGFGASGRQVIAGRVLADMDTSGIQGVRVAIAGTGIATTTGSDGSFVLKQPPRGLHAVVLSRDGYHTFELPALNLASPDTIHFSATVQNATAPTSITPRDTTACFIVHCNPVAQMSGPLLIIDGVIQLPQDGTISHYPRSVPPDPASLTIARIEAVAGDRSVALYGQRARAGVVNVTTRPGRN